MLVLQLAPFGLGIDRLGKFGPVGCFPDVVIHAGCRKVPFPAKPVNDGWQMAAFRLGLTCSGMPGALAGA
ncbi:hypothetical protein [Bradyrhizobium sp. USDA 10063]